MARRASHTRGHHQVQPVPSTVMCTSAPAASEKHPPPWTIQAWCRAAARHRLHLVAGFAERGPAGRVYNSAAVIGPGGLLGVYRKLHLFDWERRVFHPGDGGLPVFDLPWGRIGVPPLSLLEHSLAPRPPRMPSSLSSFL